MIWVNTLHPWAHFAAHSRNVTRFRLLFVCRVSVMLLNWSMEFGMILLLFPVLHDLAEMQSVVKPLLWVRNSTCQCCNRLKFCFLSPLTLERKDADKGFHLGSLWACKNVSRNRWESHSFTKERPWAMMKAFAFTFAVSTLASSQAEWLPQCGTLYTPPWSLLNPKSNKDECGPPNLNLVRWAESGGWCYER